MISVCVLSYERMDLLKQTLTSMLDTATEPFELIVHDDGSRDGLLLKFLDGLADSGVVSTLVRNTPGHNQGQGIAVNRMFSIAKGDLLVKCDQDCIFQPGWMGAIHQAFVSNQKLREDRDEGDVTPPLIGALGLFHYHHPPVQAADMLITARQGYEEVRDFCGSVIVVPRLTWRMFGPWDERSEAFAEDHNFKVNLTAKEGWCCALTPEDYVKNIGFGIGPSTVATSEGVQSIKPGPKLIEPRGERT